MKPHKWIVLTMGASAVVLCIVLVNPAQAQTGLSGLRFPTSDGSNFSDSELRSFAIAMMGVERIREMWTTQINGSDNEAGAQIMQSDAVREMTAVIEGQGLSVLDYNIIVLAADGSPELRERIDAIKDQVDRVSRSRHRPSNGNSLLACGVPSGTDTATVRQSRNPHRAQSDAMLVSASSRCKVRAPEILTQ